MSVPVKGKHYSWDPARGKCLYFGRPARDQEQTAAAASTHPLTDGIYADLKRECLSGGGSWRYPGPGFVDGQPAMCDK